ncbi:MAG: ribbon-helix-helix domain-containing protein [Candidatus Shapirobacteria bacterium]
MRSIINISLPETLSSLVEEYVVAGNYASKSEFFRYLLRQYSESEALKHLKTSQSQIAKGQGQVLRSLKGLRQWKSSTHPNSPKNIVKSPNKLN